MGEMQSVAATLRQRAVQPFISTRCACGQVKKTRMSSCRACYFALPEELRRALWKKIGHGYEDAYEAARAWLVDNGRIPKETHAA